MAIATCRADNSRLNNADSVAAGTWTSPGGGAGAVTEPDVFFQGVAAISRKISAAGRGIYYNNGTGINMSATGSLSACLFKVNITNYAAAPTIAAGGIDLWCGSTEANNYYNTYLGSDAYPTKGGWVLVPFSPDSAWASTRGSPPALTAITSFGIQVQAAFGAVSKAENVIIDAIDVGRGIYISGGTGADPAGTFNDAVLFDQGNITNRFGYVTEADGIISIFGRLGIGFTTHSGANFDDTGIQPTRFEDAGEIILFPDGLFTHSYSGLDIETGTGSTASFVYIESCTFIGISDGLGTVDTRPDILLGGSVGYATFFGNTFVRFHEVFEESADVKVDVLDCTFDDIERWEHYGSYIDGCTFNIAAQIPANQGMMTCFNGNLPRITNNTFTSLGANGHAIEITASGSYNFSGNKFTNFGGTPGSNLVENSGDSHAAILNSSGGLVTLNIVGGGDSPSIRNTGTGSTTIVNANVAVNINGLPVVPTGNGTEIRVYDRSQINPTLGITTTEFAGIGTENHRTSTYSFSVSVGSTFDVRIFNLDYVPLFLSNQTASTDPTNIPVDLKADRVYDDDTPPSGE